MISNKNPEKRELRRLIRRFVRKLHQGIAEKRATQNLKEFLDKEWTGDLSMADVGEVFMNELTMVEIRFGEN
jgi:hypothetical protein